MTRYRVTIRGDDAELRGYIDVESVENLNGFSYAMRDIGVVVASPAEPDYNPFTRWDEDTKKELDGTERWLCRYCGRVIPGEVSSRPCPGSPDQQHIRGERWYGHDPQ